MSTLEHSETSLEGFSNPAILAQKETELPQTESSLQSGTVFTFPAKEDVNRTQRHSTRWFPRSIAAAALVVALGGTAACEAKGGQMPSSPQNPISDITPTPSHTVVIPHYLPGQKPHFTHHG